MKTKRKTKTPFFTLKLFSILILAFFAPAIFVLLINKTKTNRTPVANLTKARSLLNVTPTPIPFEEITIPYLRGRSYSGLMEQMEKISETDSFTSYLASYKSDGLKIYGILTEPKGEMPEGGWPGIVFVHGYIPPSEYRTKVNYIRYMDYLAERGFSVFKIDLRGHDQSEGNPGGAYYSSDYVIDTLNAVNAMKNVIFVNPGKVGLWGHSMAGNIVFRAFVADKHIPAVVIWAGAGYTYSDLLEYKIADRSYRQPPPDSEGVRRRQELRGNYGDFNPESSFWSQVPATNYLQGVEGAIQLNHAEDDNVVSIEYSRNLMKVLDSTKLVHQLNEYPSGGHNINGSSFDKAMQNTVTFFNEYLK